MFFLFIMSPLIGLMLLGTLVKFASSFLRDTCIRGAVWFLSLINIILIVLKKKLELIFVTFPRAIISNFQDH